MSFSCPHFEINSDGCLRLKTDCVPGRPGCVLGSKAVFAVPVEHRIREREEENRRKAEAKRWGTTETDRARNP
ncbi:MAG: hypothetical protein Q7S40_22700 [Opitutaceae bacterium]|nr:hypothetical protein [Opitutaceae bacterium]